MKRWVRLASRLYPPAWRRRYATEFNALLDDVNAGWADFFDVLKGAFSMRFISMQFTAWKFRTIMLVFALIGTAIGATVAFSTHSQYRSRSVVRFAKNSRPLIVLDRDSAKKNTYSQLRLTMHDLVFQGGGREALLVTGPRVVYLPSPPERPTSPRRVTWILSGLGMGLLAGLLAAYGRHWRILIVHGPS